jgi:tetratricopeptide (TPR) repeat protein
MKMWLQALINAGNCKLERGLWCEATREEDVSGAWSLYAAALKQEPDCIEAIYNMSLAAKALGQYDLALEQLIMLNGLMPNQVRSNPERPSSSSCLIHQLTESAPI